MSDMLNIATALSVARDHKRYENISPNWFTCYGEETLKESDFGLWDGRMAAPCVVALWGGVWSGLALSEHYTLAAHIIGDWDFNVLKPVRIPVGAYLLVGRLEKTNSGFDVIIEYVFDQELNLVQDLKLIEHEINKRR